jgi:hypothetical protein
MVYSAVIGRKLLSIWCLTAESVFDVLKGLCSGNYESIFSNPVSLPEDPELRVQYIKN